MTHRSSFGHRIGCKPCCCNRRQRPIACRRLRVTTKLQRKDAYRYFFCAVKDVDRTWNDAAFICFTDDIRKRPIEPGKPRYTIQSVTHRSTWNCVWLLVRHELRHWHFSVDKCTLQDRRTDAPDSTHLHRGFYKALFLVSLKGKALELFWIPGTLVKILHLHHHQVIWFCLSLSLSSSTLYTISYVRLTYNVLFGSC